MLLENYWYRKQLHPLLFPLLPFSAVFYLIACLRRFSYRQGLQKSRQFSLPVIVVGNLTVGGTGKTPVVMALARFFKEQGLQPGIALRGVGGHNRSKPLFVTPETNPFEAGDEAVLIASRTNCPVTACSDRPAAVAALQQAGCNLVLCDDGLQHYRLARTVELAVIDGSRYFGNGRLLPAGPLRELPSRLQEVDFVIVNEPEQDLPALPGPQPFVLRLKGENFYAVHEKEKIKPLTAFHQQQVHAIAGIGNPQRFFEQLRHLGIAFIPHRFPDHHRYQPQDLRFADTLPILMTEKDAVKCRYLSFAEQERDKHWFLRVEPEISTELKQALFTKIKGDS